MEMAQKSDCVIVGRCGDYILRDFEPFRIFVYADLESRMERCRAKAPEDEKMTDRELKQHILGIDRKRAKYYEFYTGHKWGDRLNFDLCINTSRTVTFRRIRTGSRSDRTGDPGGKTSE